MKFKYKLKEAPEGPNLASQIGAKIGDISYAKDGKTKFIVNKSQFSIIIIKYYKFMVFYFKI